MTYLKDITAAIATMNKWQRAALAASCAESVLPIIARFARPVTRSAVDQGLDAAWKSVEEQRPDQRAGSFRAALKDLPESGAGDSYLSSYDVMIALSVLADALDVIVADDAARAARDACTGATNIYAGCDVVLSPAGSRSIRIDPRNPPPAGRLELLQTQAQFGAIRHVANATPLRPESVRQVRASAKQVASELDGVMPAFAERRGWRVQ